ncbi:MAG: Mrp/NBP35 family ATP-binding protein, partial [Chloroflexi bacterium]|nr:Mrp/NBP35 family ATP-binding protein [Chloroflexota bacterium]
AVAQAQNTLGGANFFKDVGIAGDRVTVTVILRTPGEMSKGKLDKAFSDAVMALGGVKRVSVQFELNIPDDPRLAADFPAGMKNAIAVASGKGGVGKSTVAANLAVALAKMGCAVGLLDGDLYGPNIPMMLGIKGQPVAFGGKMMPLSGHGVRVMSMGMLVEAGTPVIWRGPMLDQAIKQFLNDVMWGTLDYLIVDLPPGTGDVQLSLGQAIPLTGSIIVTTPQAVALADVVKGIAMFQQMKVPMLGIVENMSYTICRDCGRREEPFGSGGGQQMAERFKVPLLGQIPFDTRVRAGGDEGLPVVVRAPESAAAQALTHVAEMMAAKVTEMNLSAPRKHRPIMAPELKFVG